MVLRDVIQKSNQCGCTIYLGGYEKQHFSYFKYDKVRCNIVDNGSTKQSYVPAPLFSLSLQYFLTSLASIWIICFYPTSLQIPFFLFLMQLDSLNRRIHWWHWGLELLFHVFTESPDWRKLDWSLFVCSIHPDSSRCGYF